jgi:hypothetical protein
MHRSAWKGRSANFRFTEFYKVWREVPGSQGTPANPTPPPPASSIYAADGRDAYNNGTAMRQAYGLSHSLEQEEAL